MDQWHPYITFVLGFLLGGTFVCLGAAVLDWIADSYEQVREAIDDRPPPGVRSRHRPPE